MKIYVLLICILIVLAGCSTSKDPLDRSNTREIIEEINKKTSDIDEKHFPSVDEIVNLGFVIDDQFTPKTYKNDKTNVMKSSYSVIYGEDSGTILIRVVNYGSEDEVATWYLKQYNMSLFYYKDRNNRIHEEVRENVFFNQDAIRRMYYAYKGENIITVSFKKGLRDTVASETALQVLDITLSRN